MEYILDKMQDQNEISQLILRWGFYRDKGLWQELAKCFHSDGTIDVSWYSGSFKGFVDASKKMAEKGNFSKHLISAPIINIKNNKAISEANVTIMARGKIGPIEADLTSYARFYDLLEKRNGTWKVVKRITIYEKDRLDSVFPSLLFWLGVSRNKYKSFPDAYRFLAYSLKRQGFNVALDLPTDNSPKAKEIYEQGNKWLLIS